MRARSLMLAALCVTSTSLNAQSMSVEQTLDVAGTRHGEVFTVDYFDDSYVFVTGLNEVWKLDAAGALVSRGAAVIDGDIAHLIWADGTGRALALDARIHLRFTGAQYPLAMDLPRIFAGALSAPVANLPKGARFDADGNISDAQGAPLGTWSLSAQQLQITPVDGEVSTLPSAQLVAAMTPVEQSQ